MVIDGLVKINGVHMPLTLFRRSTRPAKTLIIDSDYYGEVEGAPTRSPSELPPPGDQCLHVSLNPERLGFGRLGSVYSLKVNDPSESSLPPLVVKVAVRHRSERMSREAWFYEEMERLQGTSIPLCYGYFTAEIDANSEVLDWAEADMDYDPNEKDILDVDDDEQYENIPQVSPRISPVWDENDPSTWGWSPAQLAAREARLRNAQETITESLNEKSDLTGTGGGDDSNPQDGALSNAKVWDEPDSSTWVPNNATLVCNVTALNDEGTVVESSNKISSRTGNEDGDDNNVQDRMWSNSRVWDEGGPDTAWEAEPNVCDRTLSQDDHFQGEAWSNPKVWDENDETKPKVYNTNPSEDEDDKNSRDRAWLNPQIWGENDPETNWDVESKVCDMNPFENKETTMESSNQKPNHADSTSKPNGDERTLVSVLVLERVGDMMPRCVPLDAIEFVYHLSLDLTRSNIFCNRPDVREIYSDLGEFGVEQIDIRWTNILAAPTTHDSFVCPYHGHKHQWRVVDFDRARKSNFKKYFMDAASNSHLRRLFRGLKEGYILEPWD